MFRIDSDDHGRPRLHSDTQLTGADFDQIANSLATAPFVARKSGLVAARCAVGAQRIETRWNGRETVATAAAGDWIATNLAPDGAPLRDGARNFNVYVIKAERFGELYEPASLRERMAGSGAHGDVYRSRGQVRAIELAGGFDIMTPWKEMQQADAGYLIDNGSEVYGNAKETFEATYRRV